MREVHVKGVARYIRPIGLLKTRIAVEAVVDAWYCGAPH